MTTELESLAKRIQQGMETQARYFVSSPAEMAQIGDLRHAIEFARRHHWMVVSHLGGTNYEFFKAIPSPQQQLF